MTRLQLFQEMYDMTIHNLQCYSKNYLMTEPKEKYIQEWKEENEKFKLLEEIIKEEKEKEHNITQEKSFIIRNSNYDVLGRHENFGKAIIHSEKIKNDYRKRNINMDVFVEKEGESERLYVADEYEEEFE